MFLPCEILRLIFEASAGDYKTLANAALVCKSWHEEGEFWLWHSLELSNKAHIGYRWPARTGAIMRKMKRTPEFNLHPRHLRLELVYIDYELDFAFSRVLARHLWALDSIIIDIDTFKGAENSIDSLYHHCSHNVRKLSVYARSVDPEDAPIARSLLNLLLKSLQNLRYLLVDQVSWLTPIAVSSLHKLECLTLTSAGQTREPNKPVYAAIGSLQNLKQLYVYNGHHLMLREHMFHLQGLTNLETLVWMPKYIEQRLDTQAGLRLLACFSKLTTLQLYPSLHDNWTNLFTKITPEFLARSCPLLRAIRFSDLRTDWTVDDVYDFFILLPHLVSLAVGFSVEYDAAKIKERQDRKELDGRTTIVCFDWDKGPDEALLGNYPHQTTMY